MKYLYGNSSPSNLDQNYLEFLRLSLDFSVGVLQSETKITGLHADIKEAETNADIERTQVAEMAQKVSTLLDNATTAQSTAIAVALRENLRVSSGNEVTRAQATIESNLQNFLTQCANEIDQERAANLKRIEAVLLHCDFPNSQKRISVELNSAEGYGAKLNSTSDHFLHFEIGLAIPKGNQFSNIIRVDSLMPDLQIDIPEAGGWLKRGSKISPQKLAKEYVTALTERMDGTLLSLRAAPKEGQAGYDILFTHNSVRVTRISKQQEAGEPYQVSDKDADQLKQLFGVLYKAAVEISWNRQSLTSAIVGDAPLTTFPEPDQLVLWLLEQMTPVVQDISKNTLSPTELVLKRVLSDDRREEVFASKAELFEKLEPLTDAHKAFFAPLGLDRKNQDMNGLPSPTKSNIDIPDPGELAATLPIIKIDDIPSAPDAAATQAISELPSAEEPKEEPIIVESEKAVAKDETEDQTSEIDLGDIDEEAPMPISTRTSVPPPPPKGAARTSIPPARASIPPSKPLTSSPPPRPSVGPPPPRPSTLPGGAKPSKPASAPRNSSIPPSKTKTSGTLFSGSSSSKGIKSSGKKKPSSSKP
ncbi:MAG: hypothetical protein JXX29_02425 [Deltaproteobacteria bacterium]|nr:hypothetical protein [Deltaproteobacteria bacterium]MBN2670497.1 hypothetical protein [Deltaproteobacteria bacterium]